MADAYYFGHESNTGEGILWGEALGGQLENMGSYQAHGSVAHPHGTLLSWAAISLGAYQVNNHGRRFVNENHGYSEHAMDVLAQEGKTAVEIFDQRIYHEVEGYEDFQQCLKMGAVKKFDSIEDLAKGFQIDGRVLSEEHMQFQKAANGGIEDRLGRNDLKQPLKPPYYGVRVTGALFHTQGGLKVDQRARVIHRDGNPILNLYAGGGTAVGLSGKGVSGYLSANGLLAALTLGMLAGEDAGRTLFGTG
jgi:fumarate reductase flavoprotein subunit